MTIRNCEDAPAGESAERAVRRHMTRDLANGFDHTEVARFCARCRRSVCHGCFCGHEEGR